MSVSKLIKSPAWIVETPVTEKVFTVFSTISSIVTTPEIGVCVPPVLAALEINNLLELKSAYSIIDEMFAKEMENAQLLKKFRCRKWFCCSFGIKE